MTIFVLTVAAAEAAIGLAILVIYYRNSGFNTYWNNFILNFIYN